MTTLWDKLNEDPRQQLRYPSEHVVRWLAGIGPPQRGQAQALDIGCGSGRHTKLMGDFHWIVSAIDTTWFPVCDQGDMRELPYADETFDIALAFGVFYYGTRRDHLEAISEMHRVLKPGGHGLVVTRTFRDSRSSTTRWVDSWTAEMRSGDEAGMLINFMWRPDVYEVYEGVFSEVSVELTETTRNEGRWVDSDWLISVTK